MDNALTDIAMRSLLEQLDRSQLITLIAAAVAAFASVTSAALSIYSAQSGKRREWARSSLAKTYATVIRNANLAWEAVGEMSHHEILLEERQPDGAPYYYWTEEHQADLDKAHRAVAYALAEIEMFAPAYVVAAARELHSRIWLAHDYHRLAHVQEILERGSADDRAVSIRTAMNDFVDAVRRDFGVAMAPATRRRIEALWHWPRAQWLGYQSRRRQKEPAEDQSGGA